MASSYALSNLDYVYIIINYDSLGILKWRSIDTAGYGISQIIVDDNFNIYATGSAHFSSRMYTVKYSQPLGINPQINNIPNDYYLFQNYPNPFNPETKISYEIPSDVNVTIKIFDVIGREVATLINNEFKKAGIYTVEWNASKYASGIYFYRLEAGEYRNVRKMTLVK